MHFKDILLPGNRWLVPDAYLRIFGKKFIEDIGFDVDKPKSGTKSKIPKKTMEQIEQYVDEIDDNTKQFARELNELPTSEDNRDNIMLQDIINKNEMATDNYMKLIETSLTEIGIEASTQTGGLSLRELGGLDRELRMISGSYNLLYFWCTAKSFEIFICLLEYQPSYLLYFQRYLEILVVHLSLVLHDKRLDLWYLGVHSMNIRV